MLWARVLVRASKLTIKRRPLTDLVKEMLLKGGLRIEHDYFSSFNQSYPRNVT